MQSYLDNQFDKEFKKIQNLKWLPWVGNKFAISNNRLLIVGESMCVWEDEDESAEDTREMLEKDNFTRLYIEDHGLYFLRGHPEYKNAKILRNIERAIFREANPSDDKKEILWRTTAYFVICQKILESRTDRPKSIDYIDGWNVFFDVINIIKPKICLFCGVEASYDSNLATVKSGLKPEIKGGFKAINGTYPRMAKIVINDEYTLPIVFMKHASQRFSYLKWGDFIFNYLNPLIDWIK